MYMSSPCISQLPCSVMTYIVIKKLHMDTCLRVCCCLRTYFQAKWEKGGKSNFLDLIWKPQTMNY